MKDAALTHKWEDAIGKEDGNWKARPCSRLCSNHFVPSDYLYPIQKCKKRPCLKKNAVPSVFGDNIQAWKSSSPKRSAPDDFSVSPTKLKRISLEFHNYAKHWSEEPTILPEPPATIPEPPATIPESPATIPGPPATIPEPPETIPESPATIPGPPATIPEPPATIPDIPHHNETPKENKKLKKLKIKVGKANTPILAIINSVDLLITCILSLKLLFYKLSFVL